VLFAKGRQEFNENVMRRHFAADNFWMLGRVEDVLQFFGVDHVFSVEVKLVECSVNYFLASRIWHATDADQKFVVVDVAVFACV
jgi:hypothetical protein